MIIIFVISFVLLGIGIFMMVGNGKNAIPVENGKKGQISEKSYIEKINKVVFKKQLNSLNVSEYDKKRMIYDLAYLSNQKGLDEITGKELKEAALKYFNITDLDFIDITCSYNHDDGSSNVKYIYNPEKDMYEYNENHGKHDEYGDGINYYISDGKLDNKGEYYTYTANVFYTYNGCSSSECGPITSFDVYSSYDDVVNKTNKIMNAVNEDHYCKKSDSGSYSCDLEKIYNGIKDKTKTIVFSYKKINNNYVFDNYVIK